jgi:hypothetical protein
MHVHPTLARAGAVAFLAGAGALFSSACVQNESSIFIRGCLSVPKDTCVEVGSTTSDFTLSANIDGFYRSEYRCAALLENQLVARGDITKLRTETSRVEFYRAEVQVLTNDASPKVITRKDGSPAQFSVPLAGFADPGTGVDPGIGIADVVMLDFSTLSELALTAAQPGGTHQLVVASVIVKGRTLGGLEVHSNEFRYPIDVCGGCMCHQPPGEQCAGGSTKPTPDCSLGQDESGSGVDCRNLDACTQLECDVNPMTGMPSLAFSHCPANPLAVNKSCCGAGP